MKIEVRHSDNHAGEQNIGDGRGTTVEVIVIDAQGCGPHTIHVGRYCIDENHCAALVLALQAAIAELQARAVSL